MLPLTNSAVAACHARFRALSYSEIAKFILEHDRCLLMATLYFGWPIPDRRTDSTNPRAESRWYLAGTDYFNDGLVLVLLLTMGLLSILRGPSDASKSAASAASCHRVALWTGSHEVPVARWETVSSYISRRGARGRIHALQSWVDVVLRLPLLGTPTRSVRIWRV
jgi:hypothetical protein